MTNFFWTVSIAAFLVLLGWTVVLQIAGGAYTAEFSGYPDKPHLCSGPDDPRLRGCGISIPSPHLRGELLSPLPKVAIGLWGQLPHLAEGLWMLLFSYSRTSIMLMMAMIATALAFALARVIWREFGFVAGLAVGMTLVAVTLVQRYTGMVMVDNLCASWSSALSSGLGAIWNFNRGAMLYCSDCLPRSVY